MSSSDFFVSWTFVLLSSDCFNRRWEGNGDKLQLWSPWGEGGGGGGKTKQTRMKTKNEMLRRQQAKRVRAIGQIAGLVGNYLTS